MLLLCHCHHPAARESEEGEERQGRELRSQSLAASRRAIAMAESKVRIPGIQELVRHGKSSWQVMHAKTYLGFFSTFGDAVKAKANAMDMTSAALTKQYMKSSKSSKSDEPQKFKGITRIKRRGKTFWQAQDTVSREYLGLADTAAGAAALLEAHHGEAPAQRPRNQWYLRDRQVEHFKTMSDIYSDKHGKAILPSDVEASIDMEKQYPRLIHEAPALYYIASMSKHGPFKKAVGLRWAEVYDKDVEESKAVKAMKSLKSLKSLKSKLSLRSLNVAHLQDSDLDCMIQILQIVAYDIIDIDFTLWNRNVGHGNAFYSGPFVFMSRFLGVTIKNGNTYAPCQQHDYNACREKIRACHHAGVILNRMPVQRDLDLKSYAMFVESAMKDLASLHPPGLNPDQKYSIPWILRSRLLAVIGAKKSLKSLKVAKSDTLDLIKKAFPDSKDWLDLYSKGASSVRELVLELNYKHGVELMTGFFCLFGDTEVLKYSVDYLKEHKDSIKRQLQTCSGAWREPAPSNIAQRVLRQSKEADEATGCCPARWADQATCCCPAKWADQATHNTLSPWSP